MQIRDRMKTPTEQLSKSTVALFVLLLISASAFAQVAGGAAETKIVTFFGWVARLVQVAGFGIFTVAVMIIGYKAAMVEGYKISEAKGLVIGGLMFGLAAALATYFTT